MHQEFPHLSDDLLNAWIDQTTTPDETATVEDHCASCDICQARLQSLLAVKAMLAALPMATAPRSFRLTEEMARRPIPITDAPSARPAAMVRFQPLVRMLSIASIIAVLVLAAVQASGVGQPATVSETTAPTAASQAVDNSGLVAQGDAANVETGAANLQQDVAYQVSAPTGNGLSGITIGLIVAGAAALLLTATWIWMARQSGMAQ